MRQRERPEQTSWRCRQAAKDGAKSEHGVNPEMFGKVAETSRKSKSGKSLQKNALHRGGSEYGAKNPPKRRANESKKRIEITAYSTIRHHTLAKGWLGICVNQ